MKHARLWETALPDSVYLSHRPMKPTNHVALLIPRDQHVSYYFIYVNNVSRGNIGIRHVPRGGTWVNVPPSGFLKILINHQKF